MTRNKVVIFDLDDTLYQEIDFVISAFREISFVLKIDFGADNCFPVLMNYFRAGLKVFDEVIKAMQIPLTSEQLLSLYRNHIPDISLSHGAAMTINCLKNKNFHLGIITDGRSVAQRNKIRSLKLDALIPDDNIVISEEFGSTKPDIRNFEYFMNKFPNGSYTYIGDNPKKDFLAGNALGWRTICLLDHGRNIHKQDFSLPPEYLPQIIINNLTEILPIVKS